MGEGFDSREIAEHAPSSVGGGLDMADLVVQPGPSRVTLSHCQQPILVCQMDRISQVPLRDLFLAMRGCSDTQLLGGSYRHDGGFELRAAPRLFPVESLRLVEEDMAQIRRLLIQSTTRLLCLDVSQQRTRWHTPISLSLSFSFFIHSWKENLDMRTQAEERMVLRSRGEQKSVLWAARSPRKRSASNNPSVGWLVVR